MSAPRSRTLHVLIVGGGIGGLCLAQALKKWGISFEVFERGHSVVPERQGYGFHVNADGDRALSECLPPHLYALYRATSSAPPTGDFVLLTSAMEVVFQRALRRPATGDLHAGMAVNRQTLREILLAGLHDSIRFGQDFVGFEEDDDACVEARFADGSTATGDLLVGADGSTSRVAAQLLAEAQIDDLGRAIYGKTPLSESVLADLPSVLVDGMPRVRGDDGLSVGIGTFRKTEPFDQACSRLAPDVVLTDTPDHLRWTLSVWGRPFPGGDRAFWSSHGEKLQRTADQLTAAWHPAVRTIINRADPRATFPFGIFCAQPVEPWTNPCVTLLGDAIHTMTPGRGEGANTALRDAALLAAQLRGVADGTTSWATAKNGYELEMLRYGFQATENSRRPFFAEAVRALKG